MSSVYKGKSITITGGAGTVGKELIEKLLAHEPAEIIILDHNESAVFHLLETYKHHKISVKGYVGDIAHRNFVFQHMIGVDVVFHLAAMKHVIIGEKTPNSIVQTNIIGMQNVIDAALEHNIEKFIFTSSDKAVNPTNVMGTSKLMGERLVTAANSKKRGQQTTFCATRFGNVIGSKGSVFGIFLDQIKNGGPITLTDSKMTRFFMSVAQAAELILAAGSHANGGEVFVMKMPAFRIKDLAKAMVELYAPLFERSADELEIKEIGAKPGEKYYEELMSREETRRAYELEEMFAVLPAFRSVYEDTTYPFEQADKQVEQPYSSETSDLMNVDAIKKFLQANGMVLSDPPTDK